MLDLQNYTWATANWNAPPSHCKSSRQIICRLKFMKQIPEPNWHFIFYVFYRLLTSKRNSVSVRGVARPYGLPLSACNSAVTKCRSAVSCSSLRWRKSPSGPSGLHVFILSEKGSLNCYSLHFTTGPDNDKQMKHHPKAVLSHSHVSLIKWLILSQGPWRLCTRNSPQAHQVYLTRIPCQ